MGDSAKRRSALLNRLQQQLKKKEESLADEFHFKMFLVFHFKNKEKKKSMFEFTKVLTVMNNNFENQIIEGAKTELYSHSSGQDLIDQDVVQLHAASWRALRTDVSGDACDVDFLLWPRTDIENVECLVYSKWKHDEDSTYKPLQVSFQVSYKDVQNHLQVERLCPGDQMSLLPNAEQNLFLFIKNQEIQTPKKKVEIGKLGSVCVYLRQDQLMSWGSGSSADMIEKFFFA